MKYTYETCCIAAKAEDIIDMVDNSTEITYKTFIKYVNHEELLIMFDVAQLCFGKSLKNEFHVRYHKSVYQGKPCYYLVHSAIEYIWVKPC